MISSSSSNWLDRLRSSRGFPTGEEPDLDRFISSSSSGSVESAAAATQSKSATRREKNITPKWTPPPGEFAGVLCDLFNMGGAKEEEGSRNFAKKKSSRKQPNPRFFCADLLPSSSSENNLNNNNNNNNNNNSDNNNGNENEYGGNVRVEDELNLRGVEDEEDVDLKGYTRSEVTVIDTSFEEWKSDKWVFRKNDEWRIKDKKKSKGKSRVFSGEKKKKKLSDDNNNNINNNLGNRKLDDNDVGDNQLMKKKIEDLSSLHPNKGRPRAVKEREPFREREQFVGKVPRKRFPCPRPPEKTKNNECSPVVLIKSIPLNDTDTVAKISKTPQKKRPKQIKIV